MEKGLGYLCVIYRIMYSTQTKFLDDVYPTVCTRYVVVVVVVVIPYAVCVGTYLSIHC